MANSRVRESLNPCVVPVLLVPKQDGTWRMCVDSHTINNITKKYINIIFLGLDDILDQSHGSSTKFDLKLVIIKLE